MHCLNVLNFKYMYHVVSFEFRNTFSIIEKVCMLLFNGVLSVFNEEGQTCWIFSIVWSHFLDVRSKLCLRDVTFLICMTIATK